MSLIKEIGIQEEIIVFLDRLSISPFSVIFTYCLNNGGMLAITFWLDSDIDEFLDFVEYKSLCDKSGYLILRDNNTILISGFALIDFYSKIKL